MNTHLQQGIIKAGKLLIEAQNIVIIPHHNPDGDAIGSALSLFHMLKKQGKDQVCVITPNDFPDFLHWLPGSKEVIVAFKSRHTAEKLIQDADLIIFTDFSGIGRIEEIADLVESNLSAKILIDHHPGPEPIADVLISDTSYSSTCELMVNVFKELSWDRQIDKAIASCLLTGIITDTGSFSYNSSNPRLLRIVADLLETGIDKDLINSKIYDNYSYSRMQLLGYALNEKLEFIPELHTAFIYLSKKELDEYHFVSGDTEGFVNYPLSIKGVVFSALFLEKDEYIKISFRSKAAFPANEFSKAHFSGGGHVNAAGGQFKGTLTETVERFKKLLTDYQPELQKNAKIITD